MKSLIDYKVKDLSLIMGGTREVTWVDVDGDGTLDKVIKITRNGVVKRITIKYK